jgi:hypothetical protein
MALPKLLGDGNRLVGVEGFTIPGMRQQQHFCKRTKKGKNKPLEPTPGALLIAESPFKNSRALAVFIDNLVICSDGSQRIKQVSGAERVEDVRWLLCGVRNDRSGTSVDFSSDCHGGKGGIPQINN